MSELLPCPFCGGKATLYGGPYAQETYSIWCENRHHMEGGMDQDEIKKAWNTRHIPEGYALVSKSQLMTWYDVLQEAIDSPQYDHKARAKIAVRQMVAAAQK